MEDCSQFDAVMVIKDKIEIEGTFEFTYWRCRCHSNVFPCPFNNGFQYDSNVNKSDIVTNGRTNLDYKVADKWYFEKVLFNK